MKYLLLISITLVTLSVAAQNSDTTTHDLGPVYGNLLQQQEQIKQQYEDIEKSKQAFMVGYLVGKGKTLTESDSVVWVDPKRLRVLQKKKR